MSEGLGERENCRKMSRSCFQFSETGVVIASWPKKVFSFFFFQNKRSGKFLCFRTVRLDGFQPRSKRVISCLDFLISKRTQFTLEIGKESWESQDLFLIVDQI